MISTTDQVQPVSNIKRTQMKIMKNLSAFFLYFYYYFLLFFISYISYSLYSLLVFYLIFFVPEIYYTSGLTILPAIAQEAAVLGDAR